MLKATVDEAASQFDVTSKTIREWIRDGMPVHKHGEKGAGNGAVIDMARAPNWVAEKCNYRPPRWAEFFNKNHPDNPNPFRMVVEAFFDEAVVALGVAAERWYTEPDSNGKSRWKELGLTDAQARAIVWQWWSFGGLFLLTLKIGHFERRFAERQKGMDLDDMASLFLSGDIRSKWEDAMEPPEFLAQYMPKHIRQQFEKPKRKR